MPDNKLGKLEMHQEETGGQEKDNQLILTNMPLPPHITSFVDRWSSKRDQYGTEGLDHCFDRFFTSFVIYNFLYGWITQSESYDFRGDRNSAIRVPKKYLGATALHENKTLHQATSTIVKLIHDGMFTLKSREDDQVIMSKLNTNDPEQWSLGMMEVAYQVRCNTFHGAKNFEIQQRNILRPCITIIETVSMLILEKLKMTNKIE